MDDDEIQEEEEEDEDIEDQDQMIGAESQIVDESYHDDMVDLRNEFYENPNKLNNNPIASPKFTN